MLLSALLFAGSLPMQGQKQGSDYVLHIRHLDAAGTGQVKSYTYYDGLGRPYETVKRGYTPTGKDLVQSNELDASGRVHKAVLPVSRPGSGGETGSTEAETLSSSQHGDSRGYTEYTYDALDRPLSVYGPGEAWHTSGHKQTYTYLTNKPGDALLDARLYESDLGGNLKKSGSYASGELYVTKQEDEEGRTRYEFRDKGGRTVLEREVTDEGNFDTYYVYNEWGLPSHVLPPGASASMGSDGSYGAENAALANYGYTYTYDGYLRLESYRAPGCETEYYVYDKGDRLALSQDGVQRSKGEWSYYAYDASGRKAEEGTLSSPTPLASLRTLFGGAYVKATPSVSSSGYTLSFPQGFSQSGKEVRQSYYYDDYGYLSRTGKEGLPAGTQRSKGRLTGRRVLADGAGTYLTTVYHYDAKGRVSKSISETLQGGTETEDMEYTFRGKPKERTLTHSADGVASQTRKYVYTYDGSERLKSVSLSLDGGAAVTHAEAEYDEYGRTEKKRYHGTAELETDYTYNLRGWQTEQESAQFTQRLYYEDTQGGLYDGNIRKSEWATGGSPVRSYTYTYDERGFLTESSYSEGTGSNAGRYTERQSYDRMGNIQTQERYGSRGGGSYGLIDDVTFSYDGNRLLKAEDAAPAVTDAGVMDFEDGADAPTEYTYDTNGRLTSDKNTGITGITYTPEGYPLVISYGNGNSTEYVYTADGRKLRATYRTAAENVSEPLSSVSQSTAKALVETVRDYAGDAVYENGELVRVLTPEGYVEKSGNGYAHYYYIRDYQGNVRVVADATGAVKEENGYYPFGMLHGGDGGIQPYKYNGKELDRMHGLEWYDYGARMYNGYRFTTPDRYAEKYPSLSPYQYGANNPVNVIDINGDSLKIMSSEAIEAIYHGLEDKNVTMEWQDGVLDPNSIKAQAANSNDFFLKDLYEIASSEEMVELIFSYENVYCRNGYLEIEDWEKPTDDNFDKSLTQDERKRFISMNIPLGFHIQGNLGQSLFPIFSPLSGKRSLNGNIQVIINSKGSLNHRTVGLAHEFGHVILYLNNRPYGHTQLGVDEFVGVRSTTMSKRLGYDW